MRQERKEELHRPAWIERPQINRRRLALHNQLGHREACRRPAQDAPAASQDRPSSLSVTSKTNVASGGPISTAASRACRSPAWPGRKIARDLAHAGDAYVPALITSPAPSVNLKSPRGRIARKPSSSVPTYAMSTVSPGPQEDLSGRADPPSKWSSRPIRPLVARSRRQRAQSAVRSAPIYSSRRRRPTLKLLNANERRSACF